MPKPYASGIVPADADAVWGLVRDFDGLPSWHPAIAGSEIEPGPRAAEIGAVRKLALTDGNTVRERLVRLDDTERGYTYDILESPFPIRGYRATIRVAPVTSTGEAFVEWWCHFDADATDEAELADTFANGVFATGITSLAQKFGAGEQ
ncbi:Polyketide cyclase / dehydrase and lipid transport [Haloechinothrix alba]|uniref:Polyketide cyclase / dehydrase and lipid transport n=1 Tax=Haloechinothrix alba TaxID=664784 RepID=A0A238W429_9PSEU|nr:SRPBCC family protein [Haloechinothrix alba]SNR41147.1 Polyketide cyclase / dehydrase and lipid transport [Haloechinothrix alba]